MGRHGDARESHISSELSRMEAHRQHDPADEAVWENERVMFMEWAEGERKKADEEDAKEAGGGSP
ncbi:MAG: hypothetical protein OXP12_06395 [Thaumarchaeota archaeon]|nr:hypothetical protein [Nitrososphaerota archaeon]MDE0267271.1 hypothetical protein [Nitrososphaerota archaeon]MDE0526606.1 hypothetical protein [Nitrososphaerota archaeon]